ncbi:uncharacterized protein TNCV_2634021 [Trichonephila clavipes]|nr:uncharacterized protein TNCV_2634021 [Trichonephila clavipes]
MDAFPQSPTVLNETKERQESISFIKNKMTSCKTEKFGVRRPDNENSRRRNDWKLLAVRLRKKINDLLDCDEKISEKYRAFQPIRSLPTEFQPIVQSIYSWEDSKFLFDQALEELIAEESRLLQCNRDSDLVAMNSTVQKAEVANYLFESFHSRSRTRKSRRLHFRKGAQKLDSIRLERVMRSMNLNLNYIMQMVEGEYGENRAKAWIPPSL